MWLCQDNQKADKSLQQTAGRKWHSAYWKVTPWNLHQCWGEKGIASGKVTLPLQLVRCVPQPLPLRLPRFNVIPPKTHVWALPGFSTRSCCALLSFVTSRTILVSWREMYKGNQKVQLLFLPEISVQAQIFLFSAVTILWHWRLFLGTSFDQLVRKGWRRNVWGHTTDNGKKSSLQLNKPHPNFVQLYLTGFSFYFFPMKSVKTRNRCITLIPHKGPQSASLASGEVESPFPTKGSAPVGPHTVPGMQHMMP